MRNSHKKDNQEGNICCYLPTIACVKNGEIKQHCSTKLMKRLEKTYLFAIRFPVTHQKKHDSSNRVSHYSTGNSTNSKKDIKIHDMPKGVRLHVEVSAWTQACVWVFRGRPDFLPVLQGLATRWSSNTWRSRAPRDVACWPGSRAIIWTSYIWTSFKQYSL